MNDLALINLGVNQLTSLRIVGVDGELQLRGKVNFFPTTGELTDSGSADVLNRIDTPDVAIFRSTGRRSRTTDDIPPLTAAEQGKDAAGMLVIQRSPIDGTEPEDGAWTMRVDNS